MAKQMSSEVKLKSSALFCFSCVFSPLLLFLFYIIGRAGHIRRAQKKAMAFFRGLLTPLF